MRPRDIGASPHGAEVCELGAGLSRARRQHLRVVRALLFALPPSPHLRIHCSSAPTATLYTPLRRGCVFGFAVLNVATPMQARSSPAALEAPTTAWSCPRNKLCCLRSLRH